MALRRKALGRGLDDLAHASFAALVESPLRDAAPAAARAEDQSAHPEPPVSAGLRVAAVASGKGGTGKSVIASNLGVLLAKGSPVTLLDADFCLANLHLLFGLTPRLTAAHLMAGQARLEDVLLEGPAGVRLVTGGSGVPEMAGLPGGLLRTLGEALAPLDSDGGWLLIDTPAGLERQSLLFLLAADLVLVVTTEDITALTDAYAVIKTMVSHRPAADPVIVINRARTHDSAIEAYHRLAHVARRFLGRDLRLGGIIPGDEAVERSVFSRAPVAISEPASAAARALAALARQMATFAGPAGEPVPPTLPSRLGRWIDGPLFAS